MSESTRDATTSTTLANELREIKKSMDQHNRIIKRNRWWFWGLVFAFVSVTALGVLVAVDDKNDDKRECETDNANSVRDSEVLIAAVEQSSDNPNLSSMVENYRQSVQENLRVC